MKPALAALLALLSFAALAVEPAERLADPVLEARARAISAGLRCLVCQNETIDESGADLAHDVRVLLRERIAAGDSDRQAVDYIVSRYGNFVLLQPPVEPSTYILWFAAPALLALAGASIAFGARRARDAPKPLDDAERIRLAALMQESEK